jgi:hypothetical protein
VAVVAVAAMIRLRLNDGQAMTDRGSGLSDLHEQAPLWQVAVTYRQTGPLGSRFGNQFNNFILCETSTS